MKRIRTDDIGFGTLRLIQQPEDFCFGIDAVILADFAAKQVKAGDLVMDLGTGNGIIPLILSHKSKADQIYGLEVQEGAFRLAKENAEMNGLTSRVHMISGDVREIGMGQNPGFAGTFDVVTANPPYMKPEGSLHGQNPAKSIARHETLGTLDDFFEAAARLLKFRGSFLVVHRPARLADLFAAGERFGLEPKVLQPVAPKPEGRPNLVLIQFVRGGGRELTLCKTLSVRNGNGEYSDEILEIYEK